MLKTIWKVAKIVMIVLVISFLLFQNYENKLEIISVTENFSYENKKLNERINTLVDNDRKLLQDIQESFRKIDTTKEDFNRNFEMSEYVTIFELSLMRKNIRDIYSYINKHIEELQKSVYGADIQKILNGSVFVNGIFGAGSGTVIKAMDNSMYILTCYHIVDDIIIMNEQGYSFGASIGYTKNDNFDSIQGMTIYGAEIIKYDKENDLALLKINILDKNLEAITIATKEPEKGDTIYSVGNPLGLYRTISKGILANKIENFYVFDGIITFGNSGGGLYNTDNELIGVPSYILGYEIGENYVPESGLGHAINLNRIKIFLEEVEY